MIRSFVALLLFFFAAVGMADAGKGKSVQLAPHKVYIPESGFDDNDRVEIVVEGELPNPCYTLTDTVVERSDDGKTIHLRQMAWRRLSGACAKENRTPDPIPYVVAAPLGQLDAGDYKVTFHENSGALRERSFRVDEAKTGQADNFYYGVVTQIQSEDTYPAEKPFRVVVKGLIPSTCLELDPNAKVEVVQDTILILPVLTTNLEDCHPIRRPFRHEFTVPGQPAGSYMIHVRTRGGSALYRPATLVK